MRAATRCRWRRWRSAASTANLASRSSSLAVVLVPTQNVKASRVLDLEGEEDGSQREIASAERTAKAIQAKLDRLAEAFLFERSIEIETYDRQAEKLREELTLTRIDRHSGQLDELDVEGILPFAERVLPRAADLWVQTSLEQRQRFQQLFFPEGIAFDGKGFVGQEMKGWLANRSSLGGDEAHLCASRYGGQPPPES